MLNPKVLIKMLNSRASMIQQGLQEGLLRGSIRGRRGSVDGKQRAIPSLGLG